MDQTINEMVYTGRINNTVRSWNDQLDGKMTSGGSIIASDGTTYKKVGNRLVQVLDPKMIKCVKRLEEKLIADGLVKATIQDECAVCKDPVVTAETDLIAEL